MHRKDLIKKGFRGGWHSTSKSYLKKIAEELKVSGRISQYRIVEETPGYELYVKDASNFNADIDKVDMAIQEQIQSEEGRWGYPANQRAALKKFVKQARAKNLSGQQLYNYWHEFNVFGVSITGRMTGNRAFEKVFGNG